MLRTAFLMGDRVLKSAYFASETYYFTILLVFLFSSPDGM